jgi:hypothetical protein
MVLFFQPFRSLTHLSLNERVSGFFDDSYTPIELLTVRYLDLWILDGISIHALHDMRMHAVESLTIRGCIYVALVAFVCYPDHNQKYPVLRSLKFISNTHPSSQFHLSRGLDPGTMSVRFMEMFSTVEELSLSAEADYTAIFTELREQKSSNGLLWPRLQRVAFTPSSSTSAGKWTMSEIIGIIDDYIIHGNRGLRQSCPLCADRMQLQQMRVRVAIEQCYFDV